MEIKLLMDEKYELAELSKDLLSEEIQNTVLFKELCLIGQEELNSIEKIIGECILLDFEAGEEECVTRSSLFLKDGRILVLKSKRMDMELLFKHIFNLVGFIGESSLSRIATIIKCLLDQFTIILDDESSEVYVLLWKCNKEFRKVNNVQVYGIINDYLKERLGGVWSEEKINRILKQLERIGVIEMKDGFVNVKDKIYLG